MMPSTPIFAILLIAAGALSACASGQFQSTNAKVATASPATDLGCPDVTQLHAAHLYGSWTVELAQTRQQGTLTLRQHPEFAASLRGEFRYDGHTSIASGDVEGGEFNLDESRDGKTLFAFWSGQLVPSACGAEIRGTWQPLAREGQPAAAESSFVLRRPAGESSW